MNTFTIKCFASVNNDTLPKMGEIRLPMTSYTFDTRMALGVEFAAASTVRTNLVDMYSAQVDGTNYGTTYSFTSGFTNLYFQNSEGYVFLDKYNELIRIDLESSLTDRPLFSDIDLGMIGACPKLTRFYAATAYSDVIHGSIDGFMNADNMWSVSFIGTKTTGDTSTFANNTAMLDARFWRTGITGKFSDFAKAIRLSRLSCTSDGIERDWEDLCDAMVSNGRNSGYLRIETNDIGDFYVDFDNSGWHVRE